MSFGELAQRRSRSFAEDDPLDLDLRVVQIEETGDQPAREGLLKFVRKTWQKRHGERPDDEVWAETVQAARAGIARQQRERRTGIREQRIKRHQETVPRIISRFEEHRPEPIPGLEPPPPMPPKLRKLESRFQRTVPGPEAVEPPLPPARPLFGPKVGEGPKPRPYRGLEIDERARRYPTTETYKELTEIARQGDDTFDPQSGEGQRFKLVGASMFDGGQVLLIDKHMDNEIVGALDWQASYPPDSVEGSHILARLGGGASQIAQTLTSAARMGYDPNTGRALGQSVQVHEPSTRGEVPLWAGTTTEVTKGPRGRALVPTSGPQTGYGPTEYFADVGEQAGRWSGGGMTKVAEAGTFAQSTVTRMEAEKLRKEAARVEEQALEVEQGGTIGGGAAGPFIAQALTPDVLKVRAQELRTKADELEKRSIEQGSFSQYLGAAADDPVQAQMISEEAGRAVGRAAGHGVQSFAVPTEAFGAAAVTSQRMAHATPWLGRQVAPRAKPLFDPTVSPAGQAWRAAQRESPWLAGRVAAAKERLSTYSPKAFPEAQAVRSFTQPGEVITPRERVEDIRELGRQAVPVEARRYQEDAMRAAEEVFTKHGVDSAQARRDYMAEFQRHFHDPEMRKQSSPVVRELYDKLQPHADVIPETAEQMGVFRFPLTAEREAAEALATRERGARGEVLESMRAREERRQGRAAQAMDRKMDEMRVEARRALGEPVTTPEADIPTAVEEIYRGQVPEGQALGWDVPEVGALERTPGARPGLVGQAGRSPVAVGEATLGEEAMRLRSPLKRDLNWMLREQKKLIKQGLSPERAGQIAEEKVRGKALFRMKRGEERVRGKAQARIKQAEEDILAQQEVFAEARPTAVGELAEPAPVGEVSAGAPSTALRRWMKKTDEARKAKDAASRVVVEKLQRGEQVGPNPFHKYYGQQSTQAARVEETALARMAEESGVDPKDLLTDRQGQTLSPIDLTAVPGINPDKIPMQHARVGRSLEDLAEMRRLRMIEKGHSAMEADDAARAILQSDPIEAMTTAYTDVLVKGGLTRQRQAQMAQKHFAGLRRSDPQHFMAPEDMARHATMPDKTPMGRGLYGTVREGDPILDKGVEGYLRDNDMVRIHAGDVPERGLHGRHETLPKEFAALNGTFMDRRFARALKASTQAADKPSKVVADLNRLFGLAQKKGVITQMNLGFHPRNLTGDLNKAGFEEGFTHLGPAMDDWAKISQSPMGPVGPDITLGPTTMKAGEWRQLLESRVGVGGGYQDVRSQQMAVGGKWPSELAKGLVGPEAVPTSRAVKAAEAYERSTDWVLENVVGAGGKVMEKSTNKALFGTSGVHPRYSASDNIKYVTMIAKLKRGVPEARAYQQVKTLFFDYSDKSAFGQNAGFFVPFYHYYEGTAQMIPRLVANNPKAFGNIHTVMRLTEAVDQAQQGGAMDPRLKPVRAQFGLEPAIQTGLGTYTLRLENPMSEAGPFAEALASVGESTTRPTSVAQYMAPWITGPIELVTGKSLMTGRPLMGVSRATELAGPRQPSYVGERVPVVGQLEALQELTPAQRFRQMGEPVYVGRRDIKPEATLALEAASRFPFSGIPASHQAALRYILKQGGRPGSRMGSEEGRESYALRNLIRAGTGLGVAPFDPAAEGLYRGLPYRRLVPPTLEEAEALQEQRGTVR